jgi:hypothetical protein
MYLVHNLSIVSLILRHYFSDIVILIKNVPIGTFFKTFWNGLNHNFILRLSRNYHLY